MNRCVLLGLVPLCLVLLASCREDDGATALHPANGPLYAVASAFFGPDGTTTYVSLLDSLEPQEVDYTRALEIPGWADLWVYDGHVFISSGEAPTITKYAVGVHGELEPAGEISFQQYGVVDAAFWSTILVSSTKAYMAGSQNDYIVWNPAEMTIEGTIALPTPPDHDGEWNLRHGTIDRNTVIRDGKMYQTLYWTDDSWLEFPQDSRIFVFDLATDTVVATHTVQCPALDVGSRDDAGNITFSNWTGADMAALIIDQPEPCMIHIPAGSETPSAPDYFPAHTGGRLGAAGRYIGNETLLFSVLYDELLDLTPETTIDDVSGQLIYKLWTMDTATGVASVVDGIDFNSGAFIHYAIDDKDYVLVPGPGYNSTELHVVDGNDASETLIDLRGWGIRLFRVR